MSCLYIYEYDRKIKTADRHIDEDENVIHPTSTSHKLKFHLDFIKDETVRYSNCINAQNFHMKKCSTASVSHFDINKLFRFLCFGRKGVSVGDLQWLKLEIL